MLWNMASKLFSGRLLCFLRRNNGYIYVSSYKTGKNREKVFK